MKLPKSINERIIADIKAELRRQGHHDTGRLEGSFRPYDAIVKNENILQAFALEYIRELEEGVPASKISISQAEFQDLEGWVRRKIGAFSEAEATGIAAAIVRKWKKAGRPLEGSREFSQSGEILHAIQTAFESNEAQYADNVFDAADIEIDAEFSRTKSGTI